MRICQVILMKDDHSHAINYLLLMTANVELSLVQSAFERHNLIIWRQTSFKLLKSLLTRHFFSSPKSRRMASSSPLSFARAIDSGMMTWYWWSCLVRIIFELFGVLTFMCSMIVKFSECHWGFDILPVTNTGSRMNGYIS